MARKRNSDRHGNSWSKEQILAVWKKGTIVQGQDAAKVRKDTCGAWIHFDKYGDTTDNGHGWEVDHIKPVAAGGTDDLYNLQPLQWQNNRRKGDDYPAKDYCAVSAS